MKLSNLLTSAIGHHCCLVCGTPLIDKEVICTSCLEQLTPLSGERTCSRCGLPLISETSLCMGCRRAPVIEGRSNHPLFEYAGLPKDVIELYKFQGEKALANLFAQLLYQHRLQPLISQQYTVVPAPPSKRGLKDRGFDQVLEIARILQQRYHIPYTCLLQRDHHDKVQQKNLNREERLHHMEKLFSLIPQVEVPKHIILLDDIATTGATLDTCYQLLRQGGAQKVVIITLAQTY